MTSSSDIFVQLDDRVRLLSAALALTSYPAQAQARRPHGTHAHARTTRKQLITLADHEAVQMVQALLDEGASLEELFALALRDAADQPEGWNEKLNDFYAAGNLAAWWQSEAGWDKAISDLKEIFRNVQLVRFLQSYIGEINERLVFIPNLCYPTDQELGLRVGGDLVLIVPPRLAWGDSPPWPYDEDPAHVYRAVLAGYGRLLISEYLREHADVVAAAAEKPLPVGERFKAFHPVWEDQFINLFVSGMVAIYLEDHVSAAEANAFIMMERKTHGLEVLPGVISIFRRYAAERASGRYNGLADLIPHFGKQLKVANRITSL